MERLKQAWIGIKSSFWFVPAIVIAFLVLVAFGIIQLDHLVAEWDEPGGFDFFSFEQEALRTFLATIAGSMMTIAGVVFSITILVLAQTAGQYSSRVLRNFMRKKGNQVILGLFVGIFIFCLFLLTNVHKQNNGVTALAGFVFAVVGVGFLIYYIHNTSISIQASEIIRDVQEETISGIEKIYPRTYVEKEEEKEVVLDVSFPLLSQRTGYIQVIDIENLLDLAEEYDCQISLTVKVGDFVASNQVIGRLGKDLFEDAKFQARFSSCLVVGKYRIAGQDVAFGIQQIVDMALRGLSAGSNDLSTTQVAIDYLSAVYIALANQELDSPVHYRKGNPFLFVECLTFSSFLDMGLTVICVNAKNQPSIISAINQTVEKIRAVTKSPDRIALLDSYGCPQIGM